MVALILKVLPLPAECTGDGTPIVVRQLCLAASVRLLLLILDHEAFMLIAVRGVKQGALLVSGITSEEILYIAHDTSIFEGFWGILCTKTTACFGYKSHYPLCFALPCGICPAGQDWCVILF